MAKERWITVNGNHILIKDGQSVNEAIKERFGKKDGGEYFPSKHIYKGKHEISEDNGYNWLEVDPDTYRDYEADEDLFDDNNEDVGERFNIIHQDIVEEKGKFDMDEAKKRLLDEGFDEDEIDEFIEDNYDPWEYEDIEIEDDEPTAEEFSNMSADEQKEADIKMITDDVHSKYSRTPREEVEKVVREEWKEGRDWDEIQEAVEDRMVNDPKVTGSNKKGLSLEGAIKSADDDVLDSQFGKSTPERKLAGAIKGSTNESNEKIDKNPYTSPDDADFRKGYKNQTKMSEEEFKSQFDRYGKGKAGYDYYSYGKNKGYVLSDEEGTTIGFYDLNNGTFYYEDSATQKMKGSDTDNVDERDKLKTGDTAYYNGKKVTISTSGVKDHELGGIQIKARDEDGHVYVLSSRQLDKPAITPEFDDEISKAFGYLGGKGRPDRKDGYDYIAEEFDYDNKVYHNLDEHAKYLEDRIKDLDASAYAKDNPAWAEERRKEYQSQLDFIRNNKDRLQKYVDDSNATHRKRVTGRSLRSIRNIEDLKRQYKNGSITIDDIRDFLDRE